MTRARPEGRLLKDDGDTWYCIDRYDAIPPFLSALTCDGDLWAYISTSGSLAAGRCDAEGSFFPYETVDRIHLRWEHCGPRTWIRLLDGPAPGLWQPFAPYRDGKPPLRTLAKNITSTRIRFREQHPDGHVAFEYELALASGVGLVRRARLVALEGPVQVQVLDGLLDLVPPGVSVLLASTMSSLTHAYRWNEAFADGRVAAFSLYAGISDKPEPIESFEALAAWCAGPEQPGVVRTLLSARQVDKFCREGRVESEHLVRGQPGAFLMNFEAVVGHDGIRWMQAIDRPRSQAQVAELVEDLENGRVNADAVDAAIRDDEASLKGLLCCVDAFQSSGDSLAAAHHTSNALFNAMRGGVIFEGRTIGRDDLLDYLRVRNRSFASRLEPVIAAWPQRVSRDFAIEAARAAGGEQAERLVLGYLPLTFSRRHGDPSRPWNRFSIRVRGPDGQRTIHYEGNWRDLFQNWEALAWSAPGWVGSMIATFLCAMTPDGHNPYRVGREGVDWEVPDPLDPWSHIGYWGDHQVVYLLRLLEVAQSQEPDLVASWWDRALFTFADVPYRLKPHAAQVAQPKATIDFDRSAHERARARASQCGADGLLVCDADGLPVLATLGEKIATLVLAKIGTLVPGGGLWLNTQRPEWNDANNALAGNGLSIVTLAYLRRLLAFLHSLPVVHRPFKLAAHTLAAVQGIEALVRRTPADALWSPSDRRSFVDSAGALLEVWRARDRNSARGTVEAPAGLLSGLVAAVLPMIDSTLAAGRRADGLYHAYNLVRFESDSAHVDHLYPMLEGQVAMLASGWLPLADCVRLLDALFESPLYDPSRASFLLYPDRALPGFLQRNRLDAEALGLPVVQEILSRGLDSLLQVQRDGTVRFSPALASRTAIESAAAAAGLSHDTQPLLDAYERILGHREFTGRSGTMFGYEGLGCIYWHMVGKLLLAVQERAFDAADARSPALGALIGYYGRIRDGLGWRRTVEQWGAFPLDPYSHTPAGAGAQQPGMTGQVKEEVLARWGELGLRMRGGRVHFQPILLDSAEIPAADPLRFTWAQVPWTIRRAPEAGLRVRRAVGWADCPDGSFDPEGVLEVNAFVAGTPVAF